MITCPKGNQRKVMRRRETSERLSLAMTAIIKGGAWVAIYVCLIIMVVLLALDPIMRYIIGHPFYWSNEVTTYLMILMAFYGFSMVLVRGKHVRVTLLFNRLPPTVQRVWWIVISLVGLFFAGFIGYAVIKLARTSFTLGVVTDTSEMPIFPWQVAGAVGLIIFLATMIMFTVKKIGVALRRSEEEN